MKLAAIGFATCAGLALSIPRPSVGETLYAVTSQAPAYLLTLDPSTGVILSSTAMVLNTGDELRTANGLATDPTTQTLYVVLQLTPEGTPSPRVLATLMPNGAATYVGGLGDAFAGLAFDADGTLYGVTGDGATMPEHLFTIDKTTATTTPVMALGNGTDGETIAYHPGDGLIYHLSGYDAPVYEKVDLSAMTVTDVPLSGGLFFEATALVHSTGGQFLMCTLYGEFFRLSDTGVATYIADFSPSVIVKGLAFGPAPVAVAETSWGSMKAAYW